MLMNRLTNEYEMIDKGAYFKEFEGIVVYSGISKNLMGKDFSNRVEEVRVAGWLLLELSEPPLPVLEDVKIRNITIDSYHQYKIKYQNALENEQHISIQNKNAYYKVQMNGQKVILKPLVN